MASVRCHLASVGWSRVVASPTSEADPSPACAGTAAPSEVARTKLHTQKINKLNVYINSIFVKNHGLSGFHQLITI